MRTSRPARRRSAAATRQSPRAARRRGGPPAAQAEPTCGPAACACRHEATRSSCPVRTSRSARRSGDRLPRRDGAGAQPDGEAEPTHGPAPRARATRRCRAPAPARTSRAAELLLAHADEIAASLAPSAGITTVADARSDEADVPSDEARRRARRPGSSDEMSCSRWGQDGFATRRTAFAAALQRGARDKGGLAKGPTRLLPLAAGKMASRWGGSVKRRPQCGFHHVSRSWKRRPGRVSGDETNSFSLLRVSCKKCNFADMAVYLMCITLL